MNAAMLGCSRLASSQHASTSGQHRKHAARVPAHAPAAQRLAGASRPTRSLLLRTGVSARATDKPSQLPSGSSDEQILWAEVDANSAASPHSTEFKEFVEAQLEVVGHAFGAESVADEPDVAD